MAKSKRIEALDIVGLHLAEIKARGTKQHAKLVSALEDFKREWKENLHHPKCPHCGKALK